MKSAGQRSWTWLWLGLLLGVLPVRDHGQSLPPIGSATGFNSEVYFDPPNEDKVRMRLAGSESKPLPGGLLDMKNLHVDLLNTNQETRLTATAPQCTVDPLNATANSNGHLHLQSGDRQLQMDGDGFLFVWQDSKTNSYLILSNRVHAVMLHGFLKP